jgi:Recombinase zinc beta ribbon domain
MHPNGDHDQSYSRWLSHAARRCAECSGPMTLTKRTSKRGRPQRVYVCSIHKTRPGQCTMKNALSVGDIDQAVVRALREYLTKDRLEDVIGQLVAQVAADADKTGAQRAALTAELARIDGELKRLGDAVAGGAAVETLIGGIKKREAERRDVLARLEHLDGMSKAAAAFDRETFTRGCGRS